MTTEGKGKAVIQEISRKQGKNDSMIRPEPPVKLAKTQRKLWDYMRLHPEVTQFATSAKGTGVARDTVKKDHEMIAGMLGRL